MAENWDGRPTLSRKALRERAQELAAASGDGLTWSEAWQQASQATSAEPEPAQTPTSTPTPTPEPELEPEPQVSAANLDEQTIRRETISAESLAAENVGSGTVIQAAPSVQTPHADEAPPPPAAPPKPVTAKRPVRRSTANRPLPAPAPASTPLSAKPMRATRLRATGPINVVHPVPRAIEPKPKAEPEPKPKAEPHPKAVEEISPAPAAPETAATQETPENVSATTIAAADFTDTAFGAEPESPSVAASEATPAAEVGAHTEVGANTADGGEPETELLVMESPVATPQRATDSTAEFVQAIHAREKPSFDGMPKWESVSSTENADLGAGTGTGVITSDVIPLEGDGSGSAVVGQLVVSDDEAILVAESETPVVLIEGSQVVVPDASPALDGKDVRPSAGYTWLHYLILVAVAFVLGLLIWQLIDSGGAEPTGVYGLEHNGGLVSVSSHERTPELTLGRSVTYSGFASDIGEVSGAQVSSANDGTALASDDTAQGLGT